MKNSKDLKKLALLGVLAGFMAPLNADAPSNPELMKIRMAENPDYKLLTEAELMTYLNANGKKLYNSLSPQGKKLALEVASRSCNGTNRCAGLNSCASADNACAGKASCEGKTKCAIADKNLAVKLVANKMAKKRQAAQGN